MRRLLTLAVSAAVALSATTAFAEGLADTIMAKPSSEATAGIHLSLGGKAHQQAKPVYGASLGFKAGGQAVSQSVNAPVAKVVEFNLSGGKVQDARIGTANFAKSETTAANGERLNLDGVSTMGWVWIVVGLAAAWYLIDQNNNDAYSAG